MNERLIALNAAIAELETKLVTVTEEWTLAVSTRDPVLGPEKERELVAITAELNLLKMRRPV